MCERELHSQTPVRCKHTIGPGVDFSEVGQISQILLQIFLAARRYFGNFLRSGRGGRHTFTMAVDMRWWKCKCHVVSRHLPEIIKLNVDVVSRYLPIDQQYKTSIFAEQYRNTYGKANPLSAPRRAARDDGRRRPKRP